jgi:sugar transferase (PEP-CTERM/EpsH1 system associated)
MHVLHTLRRAGAEMLVYDMIRARRNEFDFVVVALDDGGDLRPLLRRMHVPVHILERRPGWDWACARRIARLAKRHDVQVIHAHQYTPLTYSCMARLVGAWSRRIVFTEHGRRYPDQRRFKRIVSNRLWIRRLVHRSTAVGEAVRQALAENEAFKLRRIEVIHNGIDPDQWPMPDDQYRSDVRRSLGIDENQPVILQVGTLRPVKDHLTAILSLAHLGESGCRPLLLLAGDGPMRNQIELEVHRYGLAKQVRFLGARDDVADLWQAADVGLLTSLSEGISVALLEAMACGRPVVATDVGGNPEIVIDEQTGLLAPRGDAPALAAALHRLLSDETLRKQFGQAGRTRVEQHFSQQQMHDRYMAIYRELSRVSA